MISKLESALQPAAPTQTAAAPKIVYTPHGPTTQENLALYNKAVFTWKAPEYIQHQRTPIWYVLAGLVAMVFIASALTMQNWTMAIAILAFAVVYEYLQRRHPPKEIEITISEIGIRVGEMVFPYSHIQAFWIIYNPPFIKTLNLRVDKHFFSDIVIQLDGQDPVPIRQFLCTQIAEWEGKNERFAEVLLRLLKL